MNNNALPEIKDLSEIKTNGYYRFGNSIVISDCLGLPVFQNFVMPPVTITKPNGSAVQLMIDPNGKSWCRAFDNGAYHCWIDLDEINEMTAKLKHIDT